MKKRRMRAAACALVLLLVPLTLCVFAFALPAQYDDTFLGAFKYKLDALEAAPSPRIVIAGGSGAAFGIDSALLEKMLGCSVVNLGMYAGLGSTVPLEAAEGMLREGDTVVFMPEQSAQTLSMYFDAQSMWQAADGRFSLLFRLNRSHRGVMAGAFASFAAEKFNLWRSGVPLRPEGVYSRAAFNEYGDVANVPRPGNIMPGGADRSMPVSPDAALLSEDFVEYVRGYALRCSSKGVRFVYAFCPMNQGALDGKLPEDERYERMLSQRLGCSVIGSFREAVMESGWFYDTNFHLNDAGVVVNTVRMARDLARHLGVEIGYWPEIPEMPAYETAEASGGDNSQADCFVYEIGGGEAGIVGLSGKGAAQTVLTIPASYEGVPVTWFEKSTFAGNERLRELIIQENIRHIDDGAFEGCRALESIRLRHSRPQDCTVGGGLLSGCDARIIVPQESLAAYVTNYFWSVHAARLTADAEAERTPQVQEPGIQEEAEQTEKKEIIVYHGNGAVRADGSESMSVERSHAHMRVNTLQGTRCFAREGYVLTGWNTKPDGSGDQVGLGSRIAYRDGLELYAQWEQAQPEENFTWKVEKNEIYITGWHGTAKRCVVPERIDGRKVTRICRDAFRGAQLEEVVLPETVFCIEREAFADCSLRELMIYDTLYYVYDESFSGCDQLSVLRINAATSPAYSGTYFDTFPDKYDWLLSIRHEKKIVMFSGSSGRFGYDSVKIMEAFPDYQAANMGVYAYTNALPQLELIGQLMQEGDILLSAPEFDTVNNQFCTTNALDAHFFAMMEGNYDALSLLNLRNYSNVFEALREYLTTRSPLTSGSYEVSPWRFDDDGNAYPFDTYNVYGDLILPREGNPEDVLLKWGRADYTTGAFPEEIIECLNAAYRPFMKKGVRVYFSYTPRNIRALSEESTPQARAQLHEHLKRHLCVPVISEIEDYLYPGTDFYLIDSHLSTEGVKKRTAQVIEDLAAQLARE